jgi:hypothetical protein
MPPHMTTHRRLVLSPREVAIEDHVAPSQRQLPGARVLRRPHLLSGQRELPTHIRQDRRGHGRTSLSPGKITSAFSTTSRFASKTACHVVPCACAIFDRVSPVTTV